MMIMMMMIICIQVKHYDCSSYFTVHKGKIKSERKHFSF